MSDGLTAAVSRLRTSEAPEHVTSSTKEESPLLTEGAGPREVKLLHKIDINHDTRVFRFALPSATQYLGVPVGQHVGLSFTEGGEEVVRWYTPLSSEPGVLELLIKVYFPCPEFPVGGRLTRWLEGLREGEAVAVRGPRGKLRYLGQGKFLISDKKKKDVMTESNKERTMEMRRINMIAGGSGIAPMLQLLRASVGESDILMALVFANRGEQDILLRGELDRLHDKGVLNKLWYTLDQPPKDWTYGSGYVDEEMLRTQLFEPSEHTLNLMCGRKAMVRGLVQPLLEKIGHHPDRIVKY